jgi:N-acetylglutamate synthase-like GNAT family acetyltransferase
MTSLTIRRAGPADVQRVTELFQQVYRHSSHPFQDADDVRRFLADPRNFAGVAEDEGTIVASMAMTYYEWNDAYELGRALTHPEFRRHGAAATLMAEVVGWVAAAGLGQVFFGFPRARRIVELCGALNPPMIVSGHDAGRNVANGTRETHVIVCCVPGHARFVHVAPALEQFASPRLRNRLYGDLGLAACEGPYPNHAIVGPPGEAVTVSGMLRIDYDPRRPNAAAEIVGCDEPDAAPDAIGASIDEFLEAHRDVQHITVTVLADKIDLIRWLVVCGFEFTAYIPAWHTEGERRYDCVQLSRRVYADRPSTQDLADVLDTLQPQLMTMLVAERDLATAWSARNVEGEMPA